MPTVEEILMFSGYAGVFVLMVSNGFLSVPSSQVLYILVGYFISTGMLAFLPASLLGAIGNTVGNVLLYEVVRRHGVHYLEKFHIFRLKDIKKVEIVFKNRGLWFLFVGKLLPAIKVFIPIPAAIGKVDRRIFAGIMFTASWIWSFIFIAIGYLFGKSAALWKSYGIALMVIAGVVLFLFYRMLNSPDILKKLSHEG